jgi:tRNA modification GTPase
MQLGVGMLFDDTIAAVASPPGGAARGIVRISGPNALRCLADCFHPQPPRDLSVLLHPTALPGLLRLPSFLSPIACDLHAWPGVRSYTAQPVAELHTLGSPPLLEALVEAVCRAGARPAEPGEFTLRAFLAGRIDLVQAEAVLGVIDATDRRQLDVALAQLAGGLAAPLAELRDKLLDLLARLEADLDFPDEDIPAVEVAELDEQLSAAATLIAGLLEKMQQRLDTTAVPRAVLVGYPNAGKSSLFNALAGHQAALISHLPGTTRDYLTVELDLDGLRCLLVDTAGIEPQPQPAAAIAHAAQAVTAEQSQQADLRLLCLDATRSLNSWELDQIARPQGSGQLVVVTKIDVAEKVPALPCPAIATSSRTGSGLAALRGELRARLQAETTAWGVVPGTASRCRHSLLPAVECLQRARDILRDRSGEELVAAEVRIALNELGRVTGAVYSDDILDRIFSRFCIGK